MVQIGLQTYHINISKLKTDVITVVSAENF